MTDPRLADDLDAFLHPGDPRRAMITADPFPLYERMRAHGPIVQAPDGRWLVTGHELGNRVLREGDERWHREPDRSQTPDSLAVRVFMRSVAFRDPPVHTRLRRALSGQFTPRAIAKRRDIVRSRAAQVMTEALAQDSFDLRNGPANKMPVLVIGDLLGVPEGEAEGFGDWSRALLFLDEHAHGGSGMDEANAAAERAMTFFERLIDERRRHPGDDLVSSLVHGEGAETLSVEEIAGLCILLHIGGHSTTTDLVGNAMFHLLSRPELMTRLRSDPTLLDSAIDEMLRFDPPIHTSLPRIASVDLDLDGVAIKAGEQLHVLLAAANRDPRVFDTPSQFDPSRRDNRHLSFAAGIHSCLGAHLARLEAEEFFTHLFATGRALEFAVDPASLVWMDSYMHRGLTSLPVSWTHPSRRSN